MTDIAAVVITYNLFNVCDEVTAIVAVMITHRLIDVLDGSEYLRRMLTYRPYSNILHSLFVQM